MKEWTVDSNKQHRNTFLNINTIKKITFLNGGIKFKFKVSLCLSVLNSVSTQARNEFFGPTHFLRVHFSPDRVLTVAPQGCWGKNHLFLVSETLLLSTEKCKNTSVHFAQNSFERGYICMQKGQDRRGWLSQSKERTFLRNSNKSLFFLLE